MTEARDHAAAPSTRAYEEPGNTRTVDGARADGSTAQTDKLSNKNEIGGIPGGGREPNQEEWEKKEEGRIQKEEEEEEEEGECGFCLFMKGGPCKEEFIAWEKCVEEAEKNEENIVEKCFEVTGLLRKCMEAHTDYYEPILRAEKAMEEEAARELGHGQEADIDYAEPATDMKDKK